MQRRRLLAAALLPSVARPAAPATLPVIGYLDWDAAPPPAARTPLAVMLARLAELGRVEGRDFRLDARHASGDAAALRRLARALVEAAPRLVLVRSAGIAAAVREHTTTLPVVAMLAGQLEAEPGVQSLARPGVNLTGMQLHSPELVGKRMQLLKELLPGLARVVVLRGVPFDGPGFALYRSANDAAAAQLGVSARYVQFSRAEELEPLFAALRPAAGEAMLTWGNPHLNTQRRLLATLALKHRVPVLHDIRSPSSSRSELMVYGPRIADVVREAAGHVVKILDGADAAELPIGRASTFELLINRRIARALGIVVPQSLLLRADEVIG